MGAMMLLLPQRLLACATCYGESDAPMARGVTFAILFLGMVIASVLAGVVAFFVHARRKAAAQGGAVVPAESA